MPQVISRALHTFWQAFVVVFFAGLWNVMNAFQNNSGWKDALVALVLAAIAAGLSALKTTVSNSTN